MKKILEVNEDNLTDKNLIAQWLTDCRQRTKPCIIIYYHGKLAQITATLSHLFQNENLHVQLNEKELDKAFFFLGLKYFQSTLHFWKYNQKFFTFDDIDREMAKQAATEIYLILEKLISIEHQSRPNPQGGTPSFQ